MPINFDVIEIDGIAHYMRNCREDIGEVCVESHHPSVRIYWQLYNLKKSLKSIFLYSYIMMLGFVFVMKIIVILNKNVFVEEV